MAVWKGYFEGGDACPDLGEPLVLTFPSLAKWISACFVWNPDKTLIETLIKSRLWIMVYFMGLVMDLNTH